MSAAASTVSHSHAATNRVRRARAFHRPVRLWIVSLLLVIAFVAFSGFLALAVAIPLTGDRLVGVASLVSLVVFITARISAFILSSRLHCGLCHGTVLSEKKCRKHVDAVRIRPLSYRATAAVSALITLSFRCMYCGTPYRLWK